MRGIRLFVGMGISLAACGGQVEGTPGGRTSPPPAQSPPGDDAAAPRPPANAAASCDDDLHPALLPARAPTLDSATACAATPTFARPSSVSETQSQIVGRWVACSGMAPLSSDPAAVIEFGGNGRYRVFSHDASGVLT